MKLTKSQENNSIVRFSDKSFRPKVPADLHKALKATPKAKATWGDITPIARRDWILWIISGKLAETRKRRIEKACSMLSSGKRRVCCFGGINWLIKTGAVLKSKKIYKNQP